MSLQKRLRLYGKPATKDEIAAEVAKLLLSKTGATEISRILDFNSVKTVYNYRDLAIELDYLKLDTDGKPILPEKKQDTQFKEFTKAHPFVKEPLVSEWVTDLQYRKNGKPLTTWRLYIRTVEAVCNTLRINPRALITGITTKDILERSEKYLQQFLEVYKTGDAKMNYNANPNHVDMTNVAYTFSKGIRDFMNFHGIRYPKGKTGVMSQKVPNHAKYADIRLTDEELEKAKKYLIGKYGLDSDEVRLIFVAIESCSRANALIGMNLEFETHVSEKTKNVTYIMKAYESKTKHLKGGIWKKFVTWSETQEAIDKLKSRGGSKLYEAKLSDKDIKLHLTKVSQDLFVYLGKIPNLEELVKMRENKIKNTGNYYFDHPMHVFRHIGAHYWLSKKGYNYGLVGVLGGWHTISELKDSYGEMPYSVVLGLLENES